MRRLATLMAALSLAAPIGCGSSDEPDEAPPQKFGSFFGVAPQAAPAEPDLARMVRGGIGSYHLLMAWPRIEPTPGAYDWTEYDTIMGQLARAGLEPAPYLFGTPRTYAETASQPPTSSDEALDAWADFVREAATRYGPDGTFWEQLGRTDPEVEPQPVTSWEIWNEPNSSLFWSPNPDPDAYADLVERSAKVLREVDPEAEIVTGGVFATPASADAIVSYDFLAEVYAREGIDKLIDVVGVHPYAPRIGGKLGVVDQVEKTRAVVDESGDDAELWVTEIGWGADPAVPNQLAMTPEKQAELLSESYGELLERRDALGLRGIVWYTWRDFDAAIGECGWCPTAGLLDADGDSKPAWLAFTELSGGEPGG